MNEDMVMRSVYLRPTEDAQLRQLAHDLKVTKSDLIRSAVGTKLRDWLASNARAEIMSDLEYGRRQAAPRGGRRGRSSAVAKAESVVDARAEKVETAEAAATAHDELV